MFVRGAAGCSVQPSKRVSPRRGHSTGRVTIRALSNRLRHSTVERARLVLVAGGCECVGAMFRYFPGSAGRQDISPAIGKLGSGWRAMFERVAGAAAGAGVHPGCQS